MTRQQRIILVRRLLFILAVLLITAFYSGYYFGKTIKPARHKKVDLYYLTTTWAEDGLPDLHVVRRSKDSAVSQNPYLGPTSPMLQWSNPVFLTDDKDYVSCYILEGPIKRKADSGSIRYQYRLIVQMYNDDDDVIRFVSMSAGVETVARTRATTTEYE